METHNKHLRCDQCGRPMDKAHRRYREETYCTTCYYREFKLGICPKCGNKARLVRKDSHAVCRKCEYAGKPCIRCGKQEYSIGKLTIYGPVCNACTVYFRDPKPCAYCGQLSKSLSRLAWAGLDKPACLKCRRAHYSTCSSCHRHRHVEITTDGKRLCKKCLEFGEIPCQFCNEPMPAGYGKECETCYLKRRLQKSTDLNCAVFSENQVIHLYREFCLWLAEHVGLSKAVSTLDRHLEFFIQLESMGLQSLSYQSLLQKYGANGLRRRMIPMRFLTEKYALSISEIDKQEDSEQRQIAVLLNRLKPSSCSRKLLNEYYNHLLFKLKSKLSSITSVRLALTPALALMQILENEGQSLPNQRHLNNYLKRTPGQRAAISGFVVFLREKHKIDWVLPKKVTKSKAQIRKEAELQLVRLLQNPEPTKAYRQTVLKSALFYFHGVTIKVIPKQPESLNLNAGEVNGLFIEIEGNRYWLPMIVSKSD